MTPDGLVEVSGRAMPFLWTFGDMLPRPEDYVLSRSGTTLADIYRAAEWEDRGPRLGPPPQLDRAPVRPLTIVELALMPANVPLALRDGDMH